jgi:hypothetical protein
VSRSQQITVWQPEGDEGRHALTHRKHSGIKHLSDLSQLYGRIAKCCEPSHSVQNTGVPGLLEQNFSPFDPEFIQNHVRGGT